jgi:predicted SnoaL-like aldol condensation-catalyzing enzyme
MTTPEENVATVREFAQRVFNEHDLAFAEKIIADDFIDHSPMPGGSGDKAGTIAMFEMMIQQMPDGKTEVLDTIASGNKVMIRSRMSGTDTNGFMPGMPPTGKKFSMESIDVLTFNDEGLNTEHYGIADVGGAMMQLGLVSPPPGG